jgi:aminopeptidase N
VLHRWVTEYRHRLVGTEDFLAVVEEVAGIPPQADLWKAWLYEKSVPPLPPVAPAAAMPPLPPITSA